jgi:anti-sigma factor ChrR (cupin superfamily)
LSASTKTSVGFSVAHIARLYPECNTKKMKGRHIMINLEGVFAAHWQNVPAIEIFPGVRKREIWKDATGANALMVEIDAGASFGELDVHQPGSEEVFVVSGVFNDGIKDYPAGTFIHNPVGSSHMPQSKEGCTLFVFFPQG